MVWLFETTIWLFEKIIGIVFFEGSYYPMLALALALMCIGFLSTIIGGLTFMCLYFLGGIPKEGEPPIHSEIIVYGSSIVGFIIGIVCSIKFKHCLSIPIPPSLTLLRIKK